MGFEPITSAIPVQVKRSTNRGIKPFGSWSAVQIYDLFHIFICIEKNCHIKLLVTVLANIVSGQNE